MATKPTIPAFNTAGSNLEDPGVDEALHGWSEHEVPRAGVLNKLIRSIVQMLTYIDGRVDKNANDHISLKDSLPKITVATTAPTSGKDGDIWMQV